MPPAGRFTYAIVKSTSIRYIRPKHNSKTNDTILFPHSQRRAFCSHKKIASDDELRKKVSLQWNAGNIDRSISNDSINCERSNQKFNQKLNISSLNPNRHRKSSNSISLMKKTQNLSSNGIGVEFQTKWFIFTPFIVQSYQTGHEHGGMMSNFFHFYHGTFEQIPIKACRIEKIERSSKENSRIDKNWHFTSDSDAMIDDNDDVNSFEFFFFFGSSSHRLQPNKCVTPRHSIVLHSLVMQIRLTRDICTTQQSHSIELNENKWMNMIRSGKTISDSVHTRCTRESLYHYLELKWIE